ncbi:unnamed protein product [Knipowitschia caucasica]
MAVCSRFDSEEMLALTQCDELSRVYCEDHRLSHHATCQQSPSPGSTVQEVPAQTSEALKHSPRPSRLLVREEQDSPRPLGREEQDNSRPCRPVARKEQDSPRHSRLLGREEKDTPRPSRPLGREEQEVASIGYCPKQVIRKVSQVSVTDAATITAWEASWNVTNAIQENPIVAVGARP